MVQIMFIEPKKECCKNNIPTVVEEDDWYCFKCNNLPFKEIKLKFYYKWKRKKS